MMTVVFYDIENIVLSIPHGKKSYRLKPVYDAVMRFPEIGVVGEQRGYCMWHHNVYQPIRKEMDRLGIHLRVTKKPVINRRIHYIKNYSDLYIFLDAIEIAYTHPDVDCFVLVSYDSDFTVLAEKLFEMGKQVIIFDSDEKLQPFCFQPPVPPEKNEKESTHIKKMVFECTKKYGGIKDFGSIVNKVLDGVSEDELCNRVLTKNGFNISSFYHTMKNAYDYISYKKGGIKNMPLSFAAALQDTRFCVCKRGEQFFLRLRDTVDEDEVIVVEVTGETHED
jgi:hypothetical protein